MEDSEKIAVNEQEPQEPEWVTAEPGGGANPIEGVAKPAEGVTNHEEGGANTTEGGANEDIQENTETGANDSEAHERESGVSENTIITVEEKETDITQQREREQEPQTGVNTNKESEVEEEERKESKNNPDEKEKDDKEGHLEEKHKEEKRSKETGSKTTTREKRETEEDVKKKAENLSSRSGACAVKSSACPRSARPSARRDAMAKFQKDQTPGVRRPKVQRTSLGLAGGASIKQKILNWCRNKTQKYEGICIENFSSSWSDGLAFCALVHRFFPSAFDFSSLKASEREKNFTLAFSTAESLADCCPLLEVSDMLLMGNKPDPLCVFTYVQALCHHLSKIEKERKEKDKDREEDRGASEAEEKERDESERSEETEKKGSDSGMKTEQETDQNENVLNVVDEKLNE